MSRDRLLLVGTITRPHGVRGGVEALLYHPDPSTVLRARRVWAGAARPGGGEPRGYPVRRAQAKPGGRVVLLLDGVGTRDGAEALRGSALLVERADVPVAPGEVLMDDVQGFDVAEGGGSVGRVEGSYNAGGGEVLVVRAPDGRLVDFPFNGGTVARVDEGARRVEVTGFAAWAELAYREEGRGGGPR